MTVDPLFRSIPTSPGLASIRIYFRAHFPSPDASEVLTDCPTDFDGLKLYLEHRDIEGIVWHHPDGRMVKIKKRDFGFRR